jgi:hypothetical protein
MEIGSRGRVFKLSIQQHLATTWNKITMQLQPISEHTFVLS